MSINPPRWSITSLIKLCMYAAVNFAVFGRVESGMPLGYVIYVVGLLIALNLLFFGLARARRGRADRKFWDAFELAGWGFIGLDFAFVDATIDLVKAPIGWLTDHEWIRPDRSEISLLHLLSVVLVYGIGPLAAATLAGWIVTRHGGPASEAEMESLGGLETQEVNVTPFPAIEDPRLTRDS